MKTVFTNDNPEMMDAKKKRKTEDASFFRQIERMRAIGRESKAHDWYDSYKDAGLFVQQGKCIESLEDDFTEKVQFQYQIPTYWIMTDKQLRCYITWRTKVRRGVVEFVPIAYVILYIYELVNHIGIHDPEDVFSKLVFLWKEFRKRNQSIDSYMKKWIRDYYVCSDFCQSFEELIEKYDVGQFYPSALIQSKNRYLAPAFLRKISDYKVESSQFPVQAYLPFFDFCLWAVMRNLEILFDMYGLSVLDVITGKFEKGKDSYFPFFDAIYKPQLTHDKRVYIGGMEIYEHVGGEWSCRRMNGYNRAAESFVGYIVKRIEARLRDITFYRYRLSLDIADLRSDLVKKGEFSEVSSLAMVLRDPAFDGIIDSSVSEYYRHYKENSRLTFEEMTVPFVQHLKYLAQTKPYRQLRELRLFTAKNSADSKGNSKNTDLQFYEQAKIAENYEDDYETSFETEVEESRLIYSQLSNRQLRMYFSWRTRFRAGKQLTAKKEWILMYASELIHGFGAADQRSVVQKLKEIICCYGQSGPWSDKDLISNKMDDIHTQNLVDSSFDEKNRPDYSATISKLVIEMIKDFYICNDFTCSFIELIQSLQLEIFFPYICLSQITDDALLFKIFASLSSYKILKSRFYSSETSPILEECFQLMIKRIVRYFDSAGFDFFAYLVGDSVADKSWFPFRRVFFYPDTLPKNKEVILCDGELYSCTNGSWSCEKMLPGNPAAPHIIGYVMKRMEKELRRLLKYKNSLSLEIKKMINRMPTGTMINQDVEKLLLNPSFDKIIDSAVSQVLREKYPGMIDDQIEAEDEPVVVHIDESRLADIREIARRNQEKLLLSDENQADIPEDHQSKEDSQSGILADISPNPGRKGFEFNDHLPNEEFFSAEDSPWRSFARVLSEPSKQALRIILEGCQTDEKLLSLADSYGIMVGIILDTINEQALLYIGDNIIDADEKGAVIFEEYIRDVRDVV